MSLAAGKEPQVRDQPQARNVRTAAGADHTQRRSRIYCMEGKKRDELNVLEKWGLEGSTGQQQCRDMSVISGSKKVKPRAQLCSFLDFEV